MSSSRPIEVTAWTTMGAWGGWWAVRLRIGCRLVPGQAWQVCISLYRSLCEAIVWSLAAMGKSERQGRWPEISLWVFNFRAKYSSSWFHPIIIWVFCLAGTRNRRLLLQLIKSEKTMQTSWICCKVKFCFRSLVFLIWISDYVWDDPWRLPSVCLGRGRYEAASP